MQSIDILMITHKCPESTRLSLGRLLETCSEGTRVWLWQNGSDEETLELVRSFATHPLVHRFHHSPENQKLWAPTNWLLENAKGDFLSKVDDDNVLPNGWAETLIEAHNSYERFGVLGCWRFQEEDFVPELAEKKIQTFPGGHRIMRNLWVEGSCFMMKRQCRDGAGLLAPGQSFTQYCKKLALSGWVNGWYYPFICYENLDDPRSPHSLVRTIEDLRKRMPLTAQYNRVATVEEWTEQLRRSARRAQEAPIDPKHWRGWRRILRRIRARVRLLIGKRNRW